MRASRPWHLAALLVVCGCSTPPPRPGPAPLASPPVASAPLPSPAAPSAPASASAALAAPVASAPPPARKGCAQASPRKAAEAPWARLLTPGACVELVNRVQGPPNPDDVLLVETTEVRRLGKADVARLRFTRVLEGKPSDATPSELMSPLIAVTRGGVYLLPPEASDDDIQRALRQPPALALGASDGRPTARNGHTFALHPRTRGGPAACLARDVPREQNNCEDTCTGMVCLSPEGGVIILEGVAAPSFGSFIQDGYDIPPPTHP